MAAARNPPAPDVRRHATLPQSWIQRENWEFETHRLLADLLLALAMMARVSGAAVIITENGLVEFQRDDRVVVTYLVASGCGHRSRATVEAAVESRRAQHRSRSVRPCGVLVGGTSDPWITSATLPADVVRGDSADDDIITGSTSFPLIHISELRSDSSRIHLVVPRP